MPPAAALLLLLPLVAWGQTPIVFDAASVRPSGPAVPGTTALRGGPGSNDPGHITIRGIPLKAILLWAYGFKDDLQISGPAWLEDEPFDILATVPSGATKQQADRMLQNLLIERFKIALHHEKKDFPAYELLVGKSGPKLQESDGATLPSSTPPSGKELQTPDKDGFPRVPPGRSYSTGIVVDRRRHIRFGLTSMSQFAAFAARETGRPVSDKTGLTGQYDFTLEYSTEGLGGQTYVYMQTHGLEAPASDGSGLTLFVALEQQLGLRLDSKKVPFDVLVIDHIDKTPTDN